MFLKGSYSKQIHVVLNGKTVDSKCPLDETVPFPLRYMIFTKSYGKFWPVVNEIVVTITLLLLTTDFKREINDFKPVIFPAFIAFSCEKKLIKVHLFKG